MSEKFRIPPMPIHTPEDDKRNRIHTELYTFAQNINASAMEMLQACLVARGTPREGVVMRPEVFEFSQKIAEALQEGFPEEYLQDMVEEMDGHENPVETLSNHVEILDITPEEKELIYSILEEKRSGRLVVYKKGTSEELGSTIIEKDQGNDAIKIMYELIGLLGGHVGKDIEVKFTELE